MSEERRERISKTQLTTKKTRPPLLISSTPSSGTSGATASDGKTSSAEPQSGSSARETVPDSEIDRMPRSRAASSTMGDEERGVVPGVGADSSCLPKLLAAKRAG